MKKWILATLMTLAAIGASTAAKGTSAAAAADPAEYGGCRWECSTTGTLYLTADRCRAACPGGFCEDIC